MSDILWLCGIFAGAYLGVRMAASPRGVLGELHDLALLPVFLWDYLRGVRVTDADVALERARLEARLAAIIAEQAADDAEQIRLGVLGSTKMSPRLFLRSR